ncbi:MAG: CcmD family protein [Candidatus Latescibacterota bacterium]
MESTFPYLFAGYAAVWLVLFAYLLQLRRRERDLREELELLRRGLAAGGREGAD